MLGKSEIHSFWFINQHHIIKEGGKANGIIKETKMMKFTVDLGVCMIPQINLQSIPYLKQAQKNGIRSMF